MCGCYAGFTSANNISLGLNKLNYRGSDSKGMASFNNGKSIEFRTLSNKIEFTDIDCLDFGQGPIIGHSRWADSSRVSLANAHPIKSAQGNILLAHNGTLTNYTDIQDELETLLDKSYEGRTDTEVLTDYIGDLSQLQEPRSKWKSYIDEHFGGTYAIVFLIKGCSKIHWMTQDSPLYYYEGQLSSDPSIWPAYFFLPNHSWGWVVKEEDGFSLHVNGRRHVFSYSINSHFSDVQEDCTDYMLKEIGEQCLLSYDYKNEIKGNNPIQIIGCGTSYHAALLGQQYFELNSERHISVHYSSEYQHQKGWSGPKIAISQSGETSDTIEVLRQWKELNKNSILITNRHESTGTQLVKPDKTLLMNAGEEVAVAATKSFTSTALMLLQLAKPKLYEDLDLNKFRANLAKVFNKHNEIRSLIPHIDDFKNYMVFGSGFNYPIAQETALKLQECAAINCQGLPAELWKHGYISICDNNFLAIVYCPHKNEPKYERVLNAIKQTKARHGYTLGIGPTMVPECDWFIETPQDNLLLQPLINNIVGQLLAYSIGKYKGLNVDCPASCAKAITVH